MAVILGKRKRRTQIEELDPQVVADTNADTGEERQELFRKHFEAKFAPLPRLLRQNIERQTTETHTLKDEEVSDWEGLSDGDDDTNVQVVVHNISIGTTRADVPKDELKTFMTNKPPSSAPNPASTAKRKSLSSANTEEAATDTANLQKDIALQRLLKESHLLEPQSSSHSLDLSGRNRHKALDLRLQGLGSKSSILAQQKMPLAHRKGIIAKATEKDQRRRNEAKENGIVLEKKGKGKRKRLGGIRRERGLGAPSVGRFMGGTLKLSKKDVAEIEGPKRGLKTKRGGPRGGQR